MEGQTEQREGSADESPVTERSLAGLLASDINTIATSVTASVATALAVTRIVKGQEPPKADPPQQDNAE